MSLKETSQRITFEFDAEDPEAMNEVRIILNTGKILSVLSDIRDTCRTITHHGDKRFQSVDDLCEYIMRELGEVGEFL